MADDDDIIYDGKTLGSYRVADLKGYLKEAGQPVSGTKATLITRFAEFLREKGMVNNAAQPNAVNVQSAVPASAVAGYGAESASTTAEGAVYDGQRNIQAAFPVQTAQGEAQDAGNAEQMRVYAEYVQQQVLLQQHQQQQQLQMQHQQQLLQQHQHQQQQQQQQQQQLLQQLQQQQQQQAQFLQQPPEAAFLTAPYAVLESSYTVQQTTEQPLRESDIMLNEQAPRQQLNGMQNAIEQPEFNVPEQVLDKSRETVSMVYGTSEALPVHGAVTEQSGLIPNEPHRSSETPQKLQSMEAEVASNDMLSTSRHTAVDAEAGDNKSQPAAHAAQRSMDDEVNLAIDQDDLQRYVGSSGAKKRSPSRHRHRGSGSRAEYSDSSQAAGTVPKSEEHAPESQTAAETIQSEAADAAAGDSLPASRTDAKRKLNTGADGLETDQVDSNAELVGSSVTSAPVTAPQPVLTKPIKLRRTDRHASPLVDSAVMADRSQKSTLPAEAVEEAEMAVEKKQEQQGEGETAPQEVGDSGAQAAVATPTADVVMKPHEDSDAVVAGNEVLLENATDVVLIRNLMRPFTISQLRQLIEQHGRIAEGDENMWLDRIKSQCVCKMLGPEDALKVQQALNRITWPDKSSKQLYVRFEKGDMLRELVERTKKGEDISPHQIVQERAEAMQPKQLSRNNDSNSRRRNSFNQNGGDAVAAEGRKQSPRDGDDGGAAATENAEENGSVLVTVSMRQRRVTKEAAPLAGGTEQNENEISKSDDYNKSARGGRDADAREREESSQKTRREVAASSSSSSALPRSSDRKRDADVDDARKGERSKKGPPKTLDELFSKTVAKPPVYYMAADAATVRERRERRLKISGGETQNEPGTATVRAAGASGSITGSTSGVKVLKQQQSTTSAGGKSSTHSSTGRLQSSSRDKKLDVIDESTDVHQNVEGEEEEEDDEKRASSAADEDDEGPRSHSRSSAHSAASSEHASSGGEKENDEEAATAEARQPSVASEHSPSPDEPMNVDAAEEKRTESAASDDEGEQHDAAVRRSASLTDHDAEQQQNQEDDEHVATESESSAAGSPGRHTATPHDESEPEE